MESSQDESAIAANNPSEVPPPQTETLPIPPQPPPPLTPDCLPSLLECVRTTSVNIRHHLNSLNWHPNQPSWRNFAAWLQQLLTGQRNPVRVKNLEKVLAHLYMLPHMLSVGKITNPDETCKTVTGLLEQLKEPEKVNFNNAWEIADLLEAELLQIGDEDYITCIWLTWPRNRIPDEIRDLVVKAEINLADDAGTKKLSNLVWPWLLEDQRDLVQEYRRDRAMINLRRSYLNIMAISLLILDLAFCSFFIAVQPSQATEAVSPNSTPVPTQASSVTQEATGSAQDPAEEQASAEGPTSSASSEETGKLGTTWTGLLLILAAGAIGSVLARATRLSQQPLPSEENKGKASEMPLGIRSLMATWSVFWAQIMLGATAALVVYLVFSSGLLNIEGLDLQTPSTLAVLSFVAGFSEPFLLNVVGKISGRVV